MKTFTYLIIILDFTQTVICKQFCNETTQDLLHVFPNVRRKREYTRWRGQTEKPTEFLVKVFDDDDDLIPPPTKMVALVPMAPRRTPPKIIVSGITVRVPPRSPEATSVDWAAEYTRFKPPAAKPAKTIDAESVPLIIPLPDKPTRVNAPKIQKADVGSSILLQDYGVVKPPKRVDVLLGRHPQRDESPPVSPKFVQYTPVTPRLALYRTQDVPFAAPALPQPALQYVPVGPAALVEPYLPKVSSSASPTVQSSTNRYVVFSKYVPTSMSHKVSTKKFDGSRPTRTTTLLSEEQYDQRQLDLDEITSNEIVITRSTKTDPDRTTKHDLKALLGSMVGRFLARTVAPSEAEVTLKETVTESTSENETTEIFIDIYPFYDARRRKGDEMSISNTTTKHGVINLNEIERTTLSPTTSNTNEPETMAIESIQSVEQITVTHAAVEPQRSQTTGDVAYYEEKDVSINAVTLRSAEEESTGNDTKSTEFSRKQNRVCSLKEVHPFNFTSIATLTEIYEKLKSWAAHSPVTEIVDITQGNLTTMENPIYMITVDDPSGGQIPSSKQTVMIVAGIQGRDHFAVAAAMYVLYQFIERSEVHSDLLNKYRFWVIPVFNPDGYEYSRNFANRREWKKNLRQNWETCQDLGSSPETCQPCEEYGIRCYLQPCYGINLDRNFEYQWIPGHELRAEHPCGDLYAGRRQLSEIETFSLTNYLHELRMPLYAFIAYKEGDVLGILYPYSHTRKRRTFDHVYRNRATFAAASAFSINGRPYVAGQTSEFLPLYAGGIEDWVDGHLGIDNSYAIIMNRPGDTKFAVSIEVLAEVACLFQRVAHEAYAAMDTLLLQKGMAYATPKPQKGLYAIGRRRIANMASVSRIHPRVLCAILCITWLS